MTNTTTLTTPAVARPTFHMLPRLRRDRLPRTMTSTSSTMPTIISINRRR